MSMAEVAAYVDGVKRRGWEQVRMLGYLSLKPWAKDLTLDDMFELPWQRESAPQQTKEEQEQALEELRAKIPTIKKMINGER